MIYFLTFLCLLIVIFVIVILIRAALFVPYKDNENNIFLNNFDFDTNLLINNNKEKIFKDMSDMIKCKTISYRDGFEMDEFYKFQKLLEERYPLLHKKAILVKIGKTGLLYKIEGNNHSTASICMSHYDVVPADESQWEKPAFEGYTDNESIWGRGAIDTKSTLCGIVEAIEILLSKEFVPQNDLYLSFSGEEEICGDSCVQIVSYLEKQGVKPSFVLDEGGAVVDHVFPGVSKDCAIVGTAEKGSADYKFEVKSSSGHSSIPPKHTAAGEIGDAVCKIESNPFKRQITKPVADMFDILGRHSTFCYKIIFSNLWCFLPLLDFISKRTGKNEMNAMLRTTVAVTKLHGSDAYNVLPSKASCGINVRLLGNDSSVFAKKYFEKIINNNNVKSVVVNAIEPSVVSDTNCKEWELLKTVIRDTWDDVIVTPYMMPARSDAGHYCKITNKVYRFSPMKLSAKDRAMTHGHNERISLDNLLKIVEFYIKLIRYL